MLSLRSLIYLWYTLVLTTLPFTLSKEWTLVLVNLNTFVQATMEEGFLGSRILTLNGNKQMSTKLSDWIQEHEGVHFQYPSEETTEEKEPIGSDDQRSTTPELEPFIRMVEVYSKEDVDIPNSGMLNVEKNAR